MAAHRRTVTTTESHLAHRVVIQFRFRFGPVDGQRKTPEPETSRYEATSGHRRVAVSFELDEGETAIARPVEHIRVDDDVTHAVDEAPHFDEDLVALALARKAADEEPVVVDGDADAERPARPHLEPVGAAHRSTGGLPRRVRDKAEAAIFARELHHQPHL